MSGIIAYATSGAAWTPRSMRLDRGSALWNREHAQGGHAARVELVLRYHKNLEAAKGIVIPKRSADGLSDFTVRVAPQFRSSVREFLYTAGINTIILWPFCSKLDPDRFPRALRLGSEVFSLPLCHWMTTRHVDYVCETICRAVDRCSKDWLAVLFTPLARHGLSHSEVFDRKVSGFISVAN
jgi:hypothetical protein